MNIKPLVLLGLGLSLFTSLADAAVLNSQELPDSIESCLASGSCTVDHQSSHDANGISAFRYANGSFSGYLFRYDLQAPSAALEAWQQVDFSSDPPTITSHNSNTPLTGSVWLQVAERYNSQDFFHSVALYLDNVQPSDQALLPRGGPNDLPKTLNFLLSNADLQNAHADKSFYLLESTTAESGDLVLNELPLVCLSTGCGIELQLNLVGMQFMAQGNEWITQFNDDPRGLLYSERQFFNGNELSSNNLRSFYVQPVPLLPSGWLLLSGLAMLFARRWQSAS